MGVVWMLTWAIGRIRSNAFILVVLSALVLTLSGPVMALKPPWQPDGPASVAGTEEKGWTVQKQKRDYTAEDGTKVSETRTVTTMASYGKAEYTQTETYTFEERPDGTKVKTYVRERADSEGKVDKYAKRGTTKQFSGGRRTVWEGWYLGKFEYEGELIVYDPVKDGNKVKEESVVLRADGGQPLKKLTYAYFSDGHVESDERPWDAKSGDWAAQGTTSSFGIEPSTVLAPTLATEGHVIGGTVKNGSIDAPGAVGVIAESTKGGAIRADIDIWGRWSLPAGALSPGYWFIYAIMADGNRGPMAVMQVLPGGKEDTPASITQYSALCFTGSEVMLEGYGLSGHDGDSYPRVTISSGNGAIVSEPLLYSDREVAFRLKEDAPRGAADLIVEGDGGIAGPVWLDIVSFDIVVPGSTKVGQEFYVTVQITGLAGEYVEKDFTVLISIIGPARFVASASKELVISIRGGVAVLRAIAESPGQYSLSGKLVGLPEP